jgi:tape measure domain-containing protein
MSSQVSITLRAIDLATKPIANVTKSLGLMKFAFVGLGAMIGREFIRVNSELEQMKVKLSGLFGGDMKVGEDALKWVREFQAANPVKSIEAMTDSFHSLVSAGIKPTEEAMKALIGGTVKYGLTEADLKRVLTAMRQITSITNAQKQELNQLAEKLPQISKKLSEELGYKSPELFQQAMKRMEVDAKSMATAVVRILGQGADEAIDSYGKTWEGGIVRFKTSWFNFMESLNSGSSFDRLKGALERVTGWFYRMTFYASNLGVEFDYLIQAGIDFVNSFIKGIVEINNLMGQLTGMGTGSNSAFGSLLIVINDAIAGFKILGAVINAQMEIAVKSFYLFKDKVTAIWKQVMGLFYEDKEQKAKDALDEKLKGKMAELQKLRDELREQMTSKAIGGILWGETEMNDLKTQIKSLVVEVETLQNALRDPASATFGSILDESVANAKKSIVKIQGAQIKANQAVVLAFNKQYDEGSRKKGISELPASVQAFTDGLLDASAAAEKMPKTFMEGWGAAMKKAKEDFDKNFGDIVAMGKYAADSLTKAFTSGFELMFQQLKEGTVNLKDVMMNILNSVYDAMAKIIAQRMALGLVAQVGSMFATAPAQVGTGASADGGMASGDNYMSNAGGLQKASSPSQKVEIINNSGQQLEVTQARSKGTGQDQILSIVIDGIMRNKGGSRDMMKGALA